MPTNYEHDPDGFWSLLENDILSNPQRLKAVTPELVARIEGLVGEVKVDLDAPIPGHLHRPKMRKLNACEAREKIDRLLNEQCQGRNS